MTIVFYTHLDGPITAALFDQYLSYLDTAGQQKILRLRRDHDQHASLLGKMLLLKGLLKFGYPKESLKGIVYTEYKRPFIDLPVDFSISHSGELVVCALNNNGKVGIDVEEIRPVKMEDFRDILAADENNDVLGAKNAYNMFFNIWTRKEAVVKANGRGLYIPLNEIIVKDDIVFLHNEAWYLKDIFLRDNYSSAVATSNLPGELLLYYVNKEDLAIVD